jgi:glutaconate CoA-transferase subunit B
MALNHAAVICLPVPRRLLVETTYNSMELMICCASRELEDGRTVAVGTGVPCAAAMLAQRLHAPNLVILFEAGGIAPRLPTMPISVGDSRTFYHAAMATSMADIMETCQRGMVDYTFLGGAQIDAYGNLNSTMIGNDYAHPKVRFPGSGGANDLASLCWRILVVTNHDKRRFVEKLDFPGVSLEMVRDRTGFELGIREPLAVTLPPSPEELRLLREEVDPHRYLLDR